MAYLMPGDVQRELHVSDETLRRMAKTGKIRCITLPSGHRRYETEEVGRVKRSMGMKVERN